MESLMTNNRPDKQLQKRIIYLAYALMALVLSVVLMFTYTAYIFYTASLILALTFFCIYLTIKTIQAAENSISYGGFANELVKSSNEVKRIDNANFEPVLENSLSKDFFKGENIISFLERNLSENRNNKNSITRLKTAIEQLNEDTIIISLNPYQQSRPNFEAFFEIHIRPISLKKTDIFEGPFSIKSIKKDIYLYWQIKDITAQKNMDTLFNEEKKELHDFLDYLPIGLYVFDKDYKIEYANHAFVSICGAYKKDEIIGRNFKDLIAPNSTSLPANNSPWMGSVYLKSGEVFIKQDSFRINQEIKIRGAMINDLPNDEDLKNNLDKAFDKISRLFNSSPVGIIFTDSEGKITDSNKSAQKLFGKKDIIGTNILDYLAEEIKDFDTSKSFDIRLKNEKVVQAYINNSNQNQIVFYLVDATKQKSLELQFAQAQKMQAMGQLAGGIAHDFNNLLTAMIGFCDLLLQRHGVGDPSFEDLHQIRQNANRAAGLVRQLLAFSRKQSLKPELIDVTENLEELSHLLKRVLGEQIVLKFHHGDNLGFIRVDPTQFSQVIINLAVNGKDAMNNNGNLNISTRVENLNEPYQFGEETIKPGEFVVIEINDTGCGIPEENFSRIFEPFFSTKQNIVGSGTGLGLAMVYGIVRQTEGFIKVKSEINKGTAFSIYLPRFEKGDEEIKNDEVEKIATPLKMEQKLIFGMNVSSIDRDKSVTNIKILFVEDEDSVRSFATRALKKKGYDVISCNSAENALEQLSDDFDLLLTDMVMPGMSGAELATLVKQKIPAIKVILASGYSEEMARKELTSFSDFEFMSKPFSLGDLTQKVFDVLTQKEKND